MSPRAFAERRRVDLDDVNPIIEVLAKALLFDLGLEIAVGRRHDARVERDVLVAADGAHRPLLQRAEELRLHLERELADLVEEQRAAGCVGEEAHARRLRVGECAARVAEELALEQRRRHGRAVDAEERPRASRPVVVQRARDELLSRAALAGDEDRGVAVGDPRHEVEDALHRRALAEHAAEPLRVDDRAPGAA